MTSARLRDFIKAYDVRGLVPQQLNAAVASALGSAFAQVIVLPEGHRAMVIGRDMRESSPELSRAFASGAAAHGVDITMIGLCSTDGLYFASGARGVPGAMFTASHNPAAYNGIKLCRSGARPVGLDTGLAEVRDLAQWMLDRGGHHDLADRERTGSIEGSMTGSIEEADLLVDYADFLHSLVDLSGGRPLKVVVDAGNGMAGHTVPAVLQRSELPLEVIPLYFELDGTFPNHEANPLEPENLRDAQAAVLAHGADLGLAFDGDADRCFVIDERGLPVTPSAITALVATREVAREVAAGADPSDVVIVHNVICSRAVPETIAEVGARALRTRVGHSYIKTLMAEHDAVFGGEHSAHYYFRDFWFADTGMLAAMHVLAALGGQEDSLSELVAPYERYFASGEVNSPVADVAAATAQVRAWGEEQGASVDLLDGLTLSTGAGVPFWWLSLRPSNTEPLLRLNVEASEEATMIQIRDEVLRMVRA